MIDKVKAMNLISRNKSVFKYDAEMTEALDLAIKALEERPQGEWIKDCDSCDCSNCYNSGARFTRKDCSGICSNCGELQCCTDNFCPNCGADMRGGRE